LGCARPCARALPAGLAPRAVQCLARVHRLPRHASRRSGWGKSPARLGDLRPCSPPRACLCPCPWRLTAGRAHGERALPSGRVGEVKSGGRVKPDLGGEARGVGLDFLTGYAERGARTAAEGPAVQEDVRSDVNACAPKAQPPLAASSSTGIANLDHTSEIKPDTSATHAGVTPTLPILWPLPLEERERERVGRWELGIFLHEITAQTVTKANHLLVRSRFVPAAS
jgi:hypothetical protein